MTNTSTTDRAERLEGANAILSAGVAAITSSEHWQEVLKTSAAFPKYSFRNIMMIYMQRPDATMVAGFNTWKKMGRFVNKGEKGIKIFAPVIVKQLNKDTGKVEQKLVAFRVVSTFDISQTSGKDVPTTTKALRLQGEAPEALIGVLFDIISSNGFTPKLVKRTASWHGMCDHTDKEVLVVDDLSPLHTVKTLLHEMGHMFAHNPDENDGKYPADRSLMEVEAESIAFTVAHSLGLDTSDYSFEYVASWARASIEEDVVKATANRVITFSRKMLALIEDAEEMPEDVDDGE